MREGNCRGEKLALGQRFATDYTERELQERKVITAG